MDNSKSITQIKLGILGGGQLGRMFIQEAINYDVDVNIMENDENAPCAKIASTFTLGNITEFEAVYNFGKNMDVLTVEIENVNIEALYQLEQEGVKVYPQPRVLEIIKDKGIQKDFYSKHNIPTAPYSIEDNPTVENLKTRIPFVHKLRTGGYDGKGVQVINNGEKLQNIFNAPSVVEQLIPFEKELSVIVARNKKGEMISYPTVECEFNEVNLVEFLFSPAEISGEVENKAQQLAKEVIEKLDMVGILAVELFLTKTGDLLVNEVAPRPHNSGHHTIECNVTSQFEQHFRSILNLPLGSTEIVTPGAMLNLIGEDGYKGPAKYDGIEKIMSTAGCHIHLYGKRETKPFRKMGHLTITAPTMENVKSIAKNVKSVLKVIS